jgi:hypothetical protein
MSLASKLEKAFARNSGMAPKDLPLLKQDPPSVVDIIEQVHDASKEMVPGFHPSAISGCKRANLFDYRFTPREPKQQDNRTLRILDNGHGVHRRIVGDRRDLGYLSQHPEIWFVPEPPILVDVGGVNVKGHSDGVLIRKADMYRWGVELKSKNHDGFMKLTKPDPAHVVQASLYAVLGGLWWITILYEDKDKQHLREFPVQFDVTAWRETKALLKELKGYVDSGELPPFDADECDPSWCSFVTKCKKRGGSPHLAKPKVFWRK